MAKNITIARLNTLVTANAVQFTKELDKASSVAKSRGGAINKALAGVGSSFSFGNLTGALGVGLGVGAVVSYGKAIMDLGGKVTDLAAVADMSQRSFQTMSVLAGDNGVSMEEVAKASETMRQRLHDASIDGADPLNKSLKRLNISAAGMSVLSTGEKWEYLAQKLAQAKDKQDAMNLVSEMFGAKIGPKMRTTLEGVAGGLEKAATQMDGLILKDEQIKRLDDAGDKFARLGKFALVFGANVLDSKASFQDLNDMLEKNIPILAKVGRFQRYVTRGFKDAPKSSIPDITAPGEYVLPGGTRKFDSLDVRAKRERDAKMNKAQMDQELEDALKYAEELEEKKAKIYQRAVTKAKATLKKDAAEEEKLRENKQFIRNNAFSENTPTDAYSRIGLMTGDRLPDIEPKKQTDLLKSINATLALINNNTKRQGASSAAFAN